MRVWMLCEASTLTGDAFRHHQTVHESLAPWCLPCESRRAAMRELENAVTEQVVASYEGLVGAAEDIESDIRDVMASGTRLRRDKYEYRYSTDYREVVWRVYPCEVMR